VEGDAQQMNEPAVLPQHSGQSAGNVFNLFIEEIKKSPTGGTQRKRQVLSSYPNQMQQHHVMKGI
jgi:hypothetical protein